MIWISCYEVSDGALSPGRAREKDALGIRVCRRNGKRERVNGESNARGMKRPRVIIVTLLCCPKPQHP